jgi:Tfp pilus assembly protein PilO
MTLTRVWSLIGAVAVLIILLAGYAAGVAPALAAASSADEEIASVELQNQVKTNELAALKDLSENSEELFAEVEELQQAIPSSHEASVFAQQLNQLAAAAGVEIIDVSFISAADAVSPDEAMAPVAPVEEGEEAPAEPAAPAPEPESTTSVPSVPGLVAMSVDINISGPYANINKFMQSVQMNSRSFSVAAVSVQPGITSTEFDMKLSGAIYVLLGESATPATSAGNGDVN